MDTMNPPAIDDELPGMLALARAVALGKWPHTDDAREWAAQWMRQVAKTPDIATDEETMVGWFANAIMAGHDRAMSRRRDRDADGQAED